MISEIIYPELKTSYKLGNPNTKFSIWRRKIDFVLFDLGVDYVLTDPKPTDDSPIEHQERFKKWVSDDFTCRHVLLGAMSANLFYLFDLYKTSKEIMEAITKQFKSTSLVHRLILFKMYKEYKMSEETNVMDHILEMGVMARDLEEAGMKIPLEMQVLILMNSLPDSWESKIGMIMHLDDKELSLDTLIRHLKIEGEWRSWKSRDAANEEEEETIVGKRRSFKGNCYVCGRNGHYQNDCPEKFCFPRPMEGR